MSVRTPHESAYGELAAAPLRRVRPVSAAWARERPVGMGLSDSDSGGEDDQADFQAQVSQLLAPIVKKQKKTEKALKGLEGTLATLKSVVDDQMPGLRREVTSASVEHSGRLERVQAELAGCASKTAHEVLRQEQTSTELRLRTALDEQRGKLAAQELTIQGLEARVEAMERAMRANEIKMGGELSAATAQLATLSVWQAGSRAGRGGRGARRSAAGDADSPAGRRRDQAPAAAARRRGAPPPRRLLAARAGACAAPAARRLFDGRLPARGARVPREGGRSGRRLRSGGHRVGGRGAWRGAHCSCSTESPEAASGCD